jgi:hypothetical protein
MCAPLTTLLVLTAFFVVPAPSCVMVPAAFASGTGPSLLLAYWHAPLQRGVPENLRDPVIAVEQLGACVLQPIGLALTPRAVTHLGITPPSPKIDTAATASSTLEHRNNPHICPTFGNEQNLIDWQNGLWPGETWEPPVGIEPTTYALRGRRPAAPSAPPARTARPTPLTALSDLGERRSSCQKSCQTGRDDQRLARMTRGVSCT